MKQKSDHLETRLNVREYWKPCICVHVHVCVGGMCVVCAYMCVGACVPVCRCVSIFLYVQFCVYVLMCVLSGQAPLRLLIKVYLSAICSMRLTLIVFHVYLYANHCHHVMLVEAPPLLCWIEGWASSWAGSAHPQMGSV